MRELISWIVVKESQQKLISTSGTQENCMKPAEVDIKT